MSKSTKSTEAKTPSTGAVKAAQALAAQVGGALPLLLSAIVEFAASPARCTPELLESGGMDGGTAKKYAAWVNVLHGCAPAMGGLAAVRKALESATVKPKGFAGRWDAREAMLKAARALREAVKASKGKPLNAKTIAAEVKASHAAPRGGTGERAEAAPKVPTGTVRALASEASAALTIVRALTARLAMVEAGEHDATMRDALGAASELADLLQSMTGE